MTAKKLSELLLERLRGQGLVPGDAEAEIGRTHASRSQAAYGAWSWSASWNGGARSVGSQFTMEQCLRAPGWQVDKGRLGKFGEISIDPDPVPPRRHR